MAKNRMASRDWEIVGVVDPQTREFSPFERVSVEMGAPVPLRDAVRDKLTDIEAIGDGIGGAFILVPMRQKVFVAGVEGWHTTGWRARWEPYAPAADATTPADAAPGDEPAPSAEASGPGLFSSTATAGDDEPAPAVPFADVAEDEVTPLGAEVDHAWSA